MKIQSNLPLIISLLLLTACGGGSDTPPTNPLEPSVPTDVVEVADIRITDSLEKALLNQVVTSTVDARSFGDTDLELKLSAVRLRDSDRNKCTLQSFGTEENPLSYTFTTTDVGECQFEYDVVPVSDAYQGIATARTRIAIVDLQIEIENQDEINKSDIQLKGHIQRNNTIKADAPTTRDCVTNPASCSTVYAGENTILPTHSLVYFLDGNIAEAINLKNLLGNTEVDGFTLEDPVAVLGQLDNSQVIVNASNYEIQFNGAFTEQDWGYSRIEYALVSATETKLGWIDISISKSDGLNRAPTIVSGYENFVLPEMVAVRKDGYNGSILPNTDEVTFNFYLKSEAPTSELVTYEYVEYQYGPTSSNKMDVIAKVHMYILDDLDGDVLSVVNDDDPLSPNLLGVALYAGTTKVEDITNASGDVIGSSISVDIERGGSHTMSYTVSDDQGGFVIGLISFRLPLDSFSYGQEWYNITVDTNTAGLDADVAEGVLKSTGNRDSDGNVIAGADEITFTAPLATQLAFALDVDFKNVFVEQGGVGAMGPEGYAITTYSYDQAVKYCTRRGGRLPTLNEMKLLTTKQGDNLYLDYAAPYTKAHNWPTSKPYWVAKRYSVEQAYVFDLNGGTGESIVDTGDASGASNTSGNYVTCVLFDDNDAIKGFEVSEYTHSTEKSIDFNAWMQFRLIDPEGEPAAYQTMTISVNNGHFANIADSVGSIMYSPLSTHTDTTAADGMMYFFYNRCVLISSIPACKADPTLTGTLYVYMGDYLKHIYAYSNADSGDSTSPLALDIYNVYASVDESSSSVTIHVPDTSNELDNRSIIRAPLQGGNLGASTHMGGIKLWEANATTDYQGVWLYRYPMTGKNFNMMLALNECPAITSCTPGTSPSAITFGLQQGFLPTDRDGIFTSESEIAGTRSYFFPSGSTATSKLSPAVKDSKNLMFNIQRSGANIDFYWQTTTALQADQHIRLTNSATSTYPNLLGSAFNQQMQYYWLDFDAESGQLRLYVSNKPVKPDDENSSTNEYVIMFTDVNWGDIDPTQPYYFVIGYHSQAANDRNEMLLNTIKYKSWD